MYKDNEKIKLLKKKYQNKSLSREERGRILEEIRHEAYKSDKRKPIDVYKHTKLACMSKLSFAVMTIYCMISFRVFPKDKDVPIDIILMVIFSLAMFITGFRYIMELSACKVEPDDEFASQNRAKAGELGFYYWFVLAFFIIGGLALFTQDRPEVRFTASDLMMGASGFFTLYMGFKDMAFLLLEGKPMTDDEGGEEE